jgi:hypothetical protein
MSRTRAWILDRDLVLDNTATGLRKKATGLEQGRRVHDSVRITSLSQPRQRLVRIMQELGFGRIEQLNVRKGQPDFGRPPRLVQEIRLGGEPECGSGSTNDAFELKNAVLALLHHLERIGDGMVEVIEVRYGLPARLIVTRTAE